MKKTKLFGWAFAATMMGASFTACTNEANEVLAQESEIKLTSEITPSRAASNLQSTKIEEGQKVGVTITGAKSDHNNIAWIVETDGFLSNTSRPIYYGDDKVTITAYHPFNPSWISENQKFSVWTNQTMDYYYKNSDLLWATATSPKTKDAIPLEFSHKLAKINVTLVKEKDDDNLKGATISICNTKISTTINLKTGDISDAIGETTEISVGTIDNDVYTASAIVIPQEVNGKFIKITHNDKTYYYTLASALVLESGHSYSYSLTVKGKQLINTSSSIKVWDDEEEIIGEATEEDGLEIVPTTQIWYTTIDGNTFTPSGTWSSKLESNTYENGKGILTFNEDVTTIDKYVTSSNMTTITLPNTVTTIEEKAFYECGYLNNITIPKNVNKIDHTAFLPCI